MTYMHALHPLKSGKNRDSVNNQIITFYFVYQPQIFLTKQHHFTFRMLPHLIEMSVCNPR